MDNARVRAYSFLIAQALLHVKWDLASFIGGIFWLRPRVAYRQLRAARRAAMRAYTFHNLAIFFTQDFVGFDEEAFWQGVARFQQEWPNSNCDYREFFERTLRGDSVEVIAPRGFVD